MKKISIFLLLVFSFQLSANHQFITDCFAVASQAAFLEDNNSFLRHYSFLDLNSISRFSTARVIEEVEKGMWWEVILFTEGTLHHKKVGHRLTYAIEYRVFTNDDCHALKAAQWELPTLRLGENPKAYFWR